MHVSRTALRIRPSSRSFSAINSLDTKNAAINALVNTTVLRSTAAGPLQGLSVSIKDNICTKDIPTSCASGILHGFTSPFDATVVRLLRDNGAEIAGKTNCDEFGMGSTNTHTIHGPVLNPFRVQERRSAGGSSGGSAAAVASDMCFASLGTDTGGSVRLPAAYCGVAGFKPSYGMISRWGVISYADSLDCVGILSKRIDGINTLYNVLNAYDPKDPTAARPESRTEAQQMTQQYGPSGSKLRIGIPQEYFPAELSVQTVSPLRKLLSALQNEGAELIPVSLPSTSFALSAYYVIASAEASSNMARYDGIQYGARPKLSPGADKRDVAKVYAHTRSVGFGAEVKRRILLGTYSLSADAFDNYFLQAQRVRNLVRRDFDRVFAVPNVLTSSDASEQGVHVLIHPSAIQTAPRLDDVNSNKLDSYVQDVLTVPASLAGLPAASVPIGYAEDDGWSVGASVVGQWGTDEMVLRISKMIEQVANRV